MVDVDFLIHVSHTQNHNTTREFLIKLTLIQGQIGMIFFSLFLAVNQNIFYSIRAQNSSVKSFYTDLRYIKIL